MFPFKWYASYRMQDCKHHLKMEPFHLSLIMWLWLRRKIHFRLLWDPRWTCRKRTVCSRQCSNMTKISEKNSINLIPYCFYLETRNDGLSANVPAQDSVDTGSIPNPATNFLCDLGQVTYLKENCSGIEISLHSAKYKIWLNHCWAKSVLSNTLCI